MSTPDRTGITQPLDQIVAVLQNATSEQRAAILAKIDQSVSSTRQEVAVTMTSTSSTQREVATVANPANTDTSPLSQEQLLDNLSGQHDASYDAWKSTYQLPPQYLANLAKKDTVIAWAKTIPQETIQAVLRYGQPRLKLLTEMSVPNLLEVLNQHPTIPGQLDSVIWWDQWKTIAAKPGDFGLTPDIEDMPQENIYEDRKNPAIIAEYKRRFEQAPHSTIMPQAAYFPSAMDEIARGKVYDRKYWTGFEQPQETDGVPRAGWYDGRVDLGRAYPLNSNDSGRGRLWVPGGKPPRGATTLRILKRL